MKIKILITALLLACVFSACNNDKEDEKKQLDEILKLHDEVMGNSETVVKNKAILDSIIKKNVTDTALTKQPVKLSGQLAKADEAMENWMHAFDPSFTGKSHAEIMTYLKNQRIILLHADSLLKASANESNKYLKAK
jgi:hypothetical protein